jgi:hypothetical protein
MLPRAYISPATCALDCESTNTLSWFHSMCFGILKVLEDLCLYAYLLGVKEVYNVIKHLVKDFHTFFNCRTRLLVNFRKYGSITTQSPLVFVDFALL